MAKEKVSGGSPGRENYVGERVGGRAITTDRRINSGYEGEREREGERDRQTEG